MRVSSILIFLLMAGIVAGGPSKIWEYRSDEPVVDVGVAEDGWVAVASEDYLYYLDDAGTVRMKIQISPLSLSLTPDGYDIAAAGRTKVIFLLDRNGIISFEKDTGMVLKGASISTDGKNVAGGGERGVILYDKDGKELWRWSGKEILDVSTDGKNVAAGSADKNVYLLENGIVKWKYATGGRVTSVAIAAGRVAAGSEDNSIYFLDSSGKLLWSFRADSTPTSVSISKDGKFVLAGCRGGSSYLFDSAGFLLWKHALGSGITASALSGDGKWVALSDRQQNVYLYLSLAPGTTPPPTPTPWPKKVTFLKDDFSDGDYTSNPAWTVLGGSWEIKEGKLKARALLPKNPYIYTEQKKISPVIIEADIKFPDGWISLNYMRTAYMKGSSYGIYLDNETIELRYQKDDEVSKLGSYRWENDGKWHHLKIVKTNFTHRVYLDDEPCAIIKSGDVEKIKFSNFLSFEGSSFISLDNLQIKRYVPEIKYSNLRIEPEQAKVGETVQIKVDVKNEGDEAEFDVLLEIDEKLEQWEHLKLGCGESREVIFEIKKPKGYYEVKIGDLSKHLRVGPPPTPTPTPVAPAGGYLEIKEVSAVNKTLIKSADFPALWKKYAGKGEETRKGSRGVHLLLSENFIHAVTPTGGIFYFDKNGKKKWGDLPWGWDYADIIDLSVSKDGKYLGVVASEPQGGATARKGIYIYDKNGKQLWKDETRGTDPELGGIEISEDGKFAAFSNGNSTVFLLERNNSKWEQRKVDGWGWNFTPGVNVRRVALSPDGKNVLVCFASNTTVLLLNESAKVKWKFKTTFDVMDVDITEDEYPLIIATPEIYLLDLEGEPEWKRTKVIWKERVEYIKDFSGISERVVVASSAYNPRFSFIRDGEIEWRYTTDTRASFLTASLSSDGKYASGGTEDGWVYYFMEDGEILWKNSPATGIVSVSLSSDGKYLAVGTNDGWAHFYRVGTLDVGSEPEGADIYVDGSLIGETPLSIYGVKTHKNSSLLLSKEGYRDCEGEINFTSPQLDIFCKLLPTAVPTPTIPTPTPAIPTPTPAPTPLPTPEIEIETPLPEMNISVEPIRIKVPGFEVIAVILAFLFWRKLK